MRIATILFANFLSVVGGCASIIESMSQTILVTSNPNESIIRYYAE